MKQSGDELDKGDHPESIHPFEEVGTDPSLFVGSRTTFDCVEVLPCPLLNESSRHGT